MERQNPRSNELSNADGRILDIGIVSGEQQWWSLVVIEAEDKMGHIGGMMQLVGELVGACRG